MTSTSTERIVHTNEVKVTNQQVNRRWEGGKELIVGGVLENDVSGLASRRAELHAYSI